MKHKNKSECEQYPDIHHYCCRHKNNFSSTCMFGIDRHYHHVVLTLYQWFEASGDPAFSHISVLKRTAIVPPSRALACISQIEREAISYR